MFKFLKEALSDAPPVNPSTTQRLASHGFPVAGAAPRRASAAGSGTTATIVAKEIVKLKKWEDDATEDDLVVKTLLQSLKDMNQGKVEVAKMEEILSTFRLLLARHVPAAQALFRINDGFEIIIETLSKLKLNALTKLVNEDESPNGQSSIQVEGEPEKSNGVRSGNLSEEDQVDLIKGCFGVLDAALLSNLNRKFFDHAIGWSSLIPILKSLSHGSRLPPSILGILVSHAFNGDESLLKLLSSLPSSSDTSNGVKTYKIPTWPAPLAISSNLALTHPTFLPVLFAFLPWPLPRASMSLRGTDPISAWAVYKTHLISNAGKLTDEDLILEEVVWRILIVALQSSLVNLFHISQQLDGLVGVILDRLYPPYQQRGEDTEDITPMNAPGRPSIVVQASSDETVSRTGSPLSNAALGSISGPLLAEALRQSQARNLIDVVEPPVAKASDHLRLILLKVLKRLLEAGVPYGYAHRLFRLARKKPPVKSPAETPMSLLSGTGSNDSTPNGSPSGKRRPVKLKLQINTLLGPTPEQHDEPGLDQDILEVIKHGMSKRWPDMFCFSARSTKALPVDPGAVYEREGGRIVCKELGKMWPNSSKGYTYLAWIYVEQLCSPITLLHLCEAKRTLLRIRVLPNSQIGITASSEADLDGPEQIFSSTDALVPHQQWVHFVVAGRKSHNPATPNATEVKVLLNGKRAGAMRYPYPRTPLNENITVHIGKDGRKVAEQEGFSFEGLEGSEWFLGPSMLLADYVGDDLGLLLHHLGPRYQGNMQEPLGKFLTYEGATALNIFLSALAREATKDQARPTLPTNSYLVKAIKEGRMFQEDAILFSYTACNVRQPGVNWTRGSPAELLEAFCLNSSITQPNKALESPSGRATLTGDVFASSITCTDTAIAVVGGPAVALKLVQMSQSSSELALTLAILFDSIKESWSASEDMERIRGFDILAGLLKSKMGTIVNVSITKCLLTFLGINVDKAENATVLNSTAYRAVALHLDLWSPAAPDVLEVFFQHYQHLLRTSKYRRFNILRCFKKAGLARKIVYALKGNLFDRESSLRLIEVLKTACVQHWSTDDTIKPLFAYIISSLCQATPTPSYLNLIPTPRTPPPAQELSASLLGDLPEILQSPTHLAKLMTTLPLHRVLIILLSSNPAIYVAVPCLEIVLLCLDSPNDDVFQRKFESEGGFILLARVLAAIWTARIRELVMKGLMGSSEFTNDTAVRGRMLPCVLAALERLLQTACDLEEHSSQRPSVQRTRSATSMSSFGPLTVKSASLTKSDPKDELSPLLDNIIQAYTTCQGFRKIFTNKRIESIIPPLTDFISVSASPTTVTTVIMNQRKKVKVFLEIINDDASKLPTLIRSQLMALHDQLRMAVVSSRPSSSAHSHSMSSPYAMSPPQQMSASMFSPSSPSRFSPASPGGRRPFDMQRKGSVSRPRSLVERTIPLRRQMTGESTLVDTKDKNVAWKQSVISAEAARFSKTTLDLKEYWRRIAQVDWPRQAAVVDADNGLWPLADGLKHWRLDGSEGPLRMRMKLERVSNNPADKSSSFYPRSQRNAIPKHDELSSAISRVDAPAGEDPFSLAMADAFGRSSTTSLVQVPEGEEISVQQRADSEDEEILDDSQAAETDKHRRIAQTLQSGDTVDEAFNIARIVGVDAAPGLLIIGKRNLYLVDGLVQTSSGEIIDCQDAPRDVLTIPSGTIAELDATESQSHRWAYTSIVETSKRSFLFRDVALELFFSDKRNFLCVFRTKKERQSVLQRLANKTDPNAMNKSAIGNFVLDTVSKAFDKMTHELETLTKRWQQREISNFSYLQVLNQFANRTPNDVTSYPVMPWVVKDYESPLLDLTNAASFRDLTLPMGALTPERREAATERYQQMEMAGEKPFQFGTHYSSSMIVCSYNIRLSPFTEMFLALQGGTFDLADRLFSSIPRTWLSASQDNRGDVRELIPEFYYNPLFLTNLNAHDFGRKQVSDEAVNDVELPPWALSDPLLFIHRHREALESDYVSRRLPAWIDLIFGYKQHDVASFTCFHPLSYAGAIDLDKMDDEGEKAATVGIIHNFGQTPKQIFNEPHAPRFLFGKTTLPCEKRFGVDEHFPVMMRSLRPLVESSVDLVDIFPSTSPDLPPQTYGRYRIPFGKLHASTLQFGLLDQSMRGVYGLIKTMCVAECTPVERATFITSNLLATAAPSGAITLWRVTLPATTYLMEGAKFIQETTLRSHELRVNHLAASEAWSLLVSSSDDGTAVIWDMNRTRYLHTLKVEPKEPVLFAAINESNGHVALLCARHLHIYTLNGAHIATARIPDAATANFTMGAATTSPPKRPRFCGGISFHQREFSKEGPLFAVGMDNNVCLWRLVPGQFNEPAWALHEMKRWPGPEQNGDVSAVKFIDETLFVCFAARPGDAASKSSLHQWGLPEGGARQMSDQGVTHCMAGCGRTFGLLEGKHRCGGCGGIFCGQDAVHVDGFSLRYCQNCRIVFALGMGVLGSRPGSRRSSFQGSSRAGSRRGSIMG